MRLDAASLLVLEDEPLLRWRFAAQLEKLGGEVTVARDSCTMIQALAFSE